MVVILRAYIIVWKPLYGSMQKEITHCLYVCVSIGASAAVAIVSCLKLRLKHSL
jgi:hypothetical protein